MAVGDRALAGCPFGVTSYFPPQAFPLGSGDGYNLRTNAPSFLASMSEPSLWCGGPAPDEGYRLLTFFPLRGQRQPAVIRIQRRGRSVSLVLSSMSPSGTAGPNVARSEKPLSMNEWAAVVAAFDSAGFWLAPLRAPHAPTTGETWIVEGRRGSNYRAVQFMPSERSSFVTILDAMLSTAGVDTHGNYAEPLY